MQYFRAAHHEDKLVAVARGPRDKPDQSRPYLMASSEVVPHITGGKSWAKLLASSGAAARIQHECGAKTIISLRVSPLGLVTVSLGWWRGIGQIEKLVIEYLLCPYEVNHLIDQREKSESNTLLETPKVKQ